MAFLATRGDGLGMVATLEALVSDKRLSAGLTCVRRGEAGNKLLDGCYVGILGGCWTAQFFVGDDVLDLLTRFCGRLGALGASAGLTRNDVTDLWKIRHCLCDRARGAIGSGNFALLFAGACRCLGNFTFLLALLAVVFCNGNNNRHARKCQPRD